MQETPLVAHRTVTRDAVASFGILTADYARLHFDHHFGDTTPYGVGVAHGLLSASWALGALCQYAPERLGIGRPDAFLAEFVVRFQDVVRFDDTIAYRASDEPDDPAPADLASGWEEHRTRFDGELQTGTVATRGSIRLLASGGAAGSEDAGLPRPEVWPSSPLELPSVEGGLTAEDLLEQGPRGECPVRTVTETDVVRFASFTGDLNPLYIDEPFAQRSIFRGRIAPPMLCFCLGFSAWLQELLRRPMAGGGGGNAGHLGDRWRFFAPVRIGDTLAVRHRPLCVRRTRSQPNRGVMTFGLQLVNQRGELVQDGEVDMMLPMRDAGDTT